MELNAGASILHYRIVEPIGEGGMGAVWRATDEKLGRDVALKVLPAKLEGDPGRQARFEREARVLASLNHPNVATLHGLEAGVPRHPGSEPEDAPTPEGTATEAANARSGGGSPSRLSETIDQDDDRPITFLVMELVEGEDLAARMARAGPVPVDEALSVALQIAEGLEAAHDRGIIHRDLKPANVMIGPDGAVKILDFGLATALEPAGAAADLSHSPTLTAQMTQAGMVLGTAGYMSPEQARGRTVDRRADIWAFGVVLWEMLTGRRLFEGGSATEVLAAVLRDEVELGHLPTGTPERIVGLLERCLHRDPAQRLQAIGEARIVLASDEPATTRPPRKEAGSRWTRAAWLVAAVAAVAAIAAWATRGPAPVDPVTVEAAVLPPASAEFVFDGAQSGSLSVSPDGRWLTFSAAPDGGEPQLFIRPVDAAAARPLPSTERAVFPFWSPDSREIAFFVDDALRRIAVDGSAPTDICPASNGRGGTWNRAGVILFAPSPSSGIHRVAAAGGTSVPVTRLDPAVGETTHRWPRFLPDERHFLYFAGGRGTTSTSEVNALWIADLETGDRARLTASFSKGLVAAGHLLYPEKGALVARPFDLGSRRITGPSTVVVPDVGGSSAYAVSDFDVSERGVMIYRTGDVEDVLQLRWAGVDPPEIGEPVGEPVAVEELAVSPDGKRLAMVLFDRGTSSSDVWIHDLDRDLRWRLTYDAPPALSGLAWTPDSRRLAYGLSGDDGTGRIHVAELDSPGEPTILLEDLDTLGFPADWMPDGAELLYVVDGGLQKLDLATGDSVEVVPPEVGVFLADLSADGRWLLYLSDQLGEMLPFVTEMPEASRRWQVSDDPAIAASWAGSRGLWMVAPGARFQRASFEVVDGSPVIGRAEPSGSLPSSRNGTIFPDGERAIVAVTLDGETGRPELPVRVVTGWTSRLETP